MAKHHLDYLQYFLWRKKKMACAFEPIKSLFAMQDFHLGIYLFFFLFLNSFQGAWHCAVIKARILTQHQLISVENKKSFLD